MKPRKYPLPEFLGGQVTQQVYDRWLARKAVAHRKRDVKRGNANATRAEYKLAIHRAVEASGGLDEYTGLPLRWDSISTYDNDESRARRRAYRQEFADLPTVDHVGDGLGRADFRICSWRTNDSKSDLSCEEFVRLCEQVLSHRDHLAQSGRILS